MRYFLIYIPIPVIILVLQTGIGVVFRDVVHVPDFMLIFCVYSTHRNGRFYGQVIGAYAGLCEDLISSAPFATHILIRTVISFLLGHTAGWRIHKTSLVPIILVLFALLIKYALYLILGIMFSISNMITFTLSLSVLYEILYTIIATPILFSLLSIIPSPHTSDELYDVV